MKWQISSNWDPGKYFAQRHGEFTLVFYDAPPPLAPASPPSTKKVHLCGRFISTHSRAHLGVGFMPVHAGYEPRKECKVVGVCTMHVRLPPRPPCVNLPKLSRDCSHVGSFRI